ncbi:MAG: TonB-dependent receptor, partial [Bacteroidota bacterium]
ISIAHKVIYEQLTLNVGVSYIGRYNQFHEDEDELQEFLYSPEANFNATYSLRQPNITFALFYKHTGAVEQYVFDSEINDFRKGKTNSFNWLDYTTTWRPTDHISIQGGVKNILNLTDINTTSGTAGAHSDAPVNVGLTYGRSYFLRLGYTF